MANIALFAETGIRNIPMEVIQWISVYNSQGHKFIVADTTGGDERFHKELSAVGAINNTLLYSMGTPKNNRYDLPVKQFNTSFDEENSSFTITAEDNSIEPLTFTGVHMIEDIALNSNWRDFKDRQIVKDSDMIILITISDAMTKRFQKIVQYANMLGKTLHIIGLQ